MLKSVSLRNIRPRPAVGKLKKHTASSRRRKTQETSGLVSPSENLRNIRPHLAVGKLKKHTASSCRRKTSETYGLVLPSENLSNIRRHLAVGKLKKHTASSCRQKTKETYITRRSVNSSCMLYRHITFYLRTRAIPWHRDASGCTRELTMTWQLTRNP